MAKKWFDVAAVAADNAASVAIRGYIGEWGVNDQDFAQEIEALGDVEQINVSINSRGGEITHALSIFNLLRNHAAKVVVRVDGVAASSASIIAMAGDEIIMPANTMMLAHRPLINGWVVAGEDDLRKLADDLKVFEGALLETYKARTGKSEDELKALLAEDRWMTAEEAVELGFADRVESLARPSAVAIAEAADIPGDVLAKVAELEAAAAEPEGNPAAEPETAAPAIEPEDASRQPAEPDTSAVIKAASKAAAAVAALCNQHGVPHLAARFIEDGMSAEQAAVQILEAKAAVDEQRGIDTTLPAPADNQNAPKDSWGSAFDKVRH